MEYCLNINFNDYDIGRNYYRNNKICIFDPIREILVIKTQEEIIRQKFVKYLINELKVPKCKIDIEVPMTYFKRGAKGRADIVVFRENNEGINNPLILIECKSPSVSLTDDVWYQAYNYNDYLGVEFIIITNGTNTYCINLSDKFAKFRYITELPKYDQILTGSNFEYVDIDDSLIWERPEFKEMLSENQIKEFFEFGWVGEETSSYLYPLVFNLAGLLHDMRIKFSPVNFDGINIIEDGHRYTSFGNASGGSFEGDYRYFILEDEERNNQIISVSIFGSLKCVDDSTYGNRKGHTTLVVAIDDFDKSHNSLQLNIDKYTKINGKQFTIWHDGTLTIGKNGAAKRRDVINYIKNEDPKMIDSSGNIILGTFDCEREIQWDNNTQFFIMNLIKYAILRDKYRKEKQTNI